MARLIIAVVVGLVLATGASVLADAGARPGLRRASPTQASLYQYGNR